MTQTFKATEKILLEPGYRQAYQPPPKADDLPLIVPEESRLTKLKKRQRVQPKAVQVRRKAAAPVGLTEVELLRTLQAQGIGRPSTYAGIVAMLLRRKYVTQEANGKLRSTTRGEQVCDFLTQTYPQIFAPDFTAQMEIELDAIAAGKRSYRNILSDFWARLQIKATPT